MGEQDNPGDSTDYLVPQVALNTQMQLADYMGIPIWNRGQGETFSLSALPFRMYNRVYNFHYRDQNLIPSLNQNTGDGFDSPDHYAVRRRGKRHDYFTASLPFQQKGDPVQLPIGDKAWVQSDNSTDISVLVSAPNYAGTNVAFLQDDVGASPVHTSAGPAATDPNEQTLYADLASATGITITDLRQSIAVQHIMERDARGGTRYPEILLSRFRVFDPQMLVLQRPEFLGGGTKAINISPVPQTAPDADGVSTPQGNLAAVGTAMVSNIGFTRSFTEHGFIMGIVSARADLTYQQGIERMWSRRARFDFYHPELAHLSEQAVNSREIYADGTDADENVWGYIGAYDDYRYGVSHVTSAFRSNNPTPLDVWHLSQFFENRPTLNQTFIEENPPVDRIIAVQDEPHFIMDAFITDIAARPMPLTGVPGLTRI